jgi:hypothetical protein
MLNAKLGLCGTSFLPSLAQGVLRPSLPSALGDALDPSCSFLPVTHGPIGTLFYSWIQGPAAEELVDYSSNLHPAFPRLKETEVRTRSEEHLTPQKRLRGQDRTDWQ